MAKIVTKTSMTEAAENKVTEGVRLSEQYRKYIDPIKEVYSKRKGRELPAHITANMAICMENLREYYQGMRRKMMISETSYTDAMATLQRHGFKIIAALMPSLVAEEIFSVQAMDRRLGEIYYLDYEYEHDKAGVAAGDVMFGASQGPPATTFSYTSDDDYYTPTGWTGDGATINFTITATRWYPVRPSTVTITAISQSTGLLTVTDDGSGNLIGDVGSGNNTITYATGAIDVTFSDAIQNGANITVTYRYDWEKMQDAAGVAGIGVPGVNIDVRSLAVTARDRMLRARWLVGAAYDLEKVHGRSAQADLLAALTAEVRHEIDGELLAFGLTEATASGAASVTFDDSPPSTYFGRWEYYKELIFTLEAASESIFQATKRGHGNYIVTGQSLMQILSGLDDFEPAHNKDAQLPTGPHFAGTFRGRWKVYRNPYFASTRGLIGYASDSWLNASIAYCPYLPCFTTPPVVLDDLRYRVGCQTSYGTASVNPRFLADFTMV